MKLPFTVSKRYFLLNCFLVFGTITLVIVGKQIFFPLSFRLISPKAKDFIFDNVADKVDTMQNDYKITQPLSFIAQAEADTNAIYSNASSYIAINSDTGSVIMQKDPEQKLPIASLTKLMSAVIALDLAKPDELITIPPQATNITPTIIGVIPGQKMSIGELLHAMLMTSANDAAEVVKDGIDYKYKEKVFVRAMNEKAQFLGLKDTHFANPQGFDNTNNYSTAYDLAELTHYALTHYPLIAQIVSQDYLFLPENQNHKQFDLYNWNGLLDVYPGVYGVKIGNTSSAGYTMIVGSKREGNDILVVLLGTSGILQRDLWASALLDDAYQTEFGLTPINITAAQLQKKYGTWKYYN